MNDYANLALQRTAFMQTPPFCSAVVRYKVADLDTNKIVADFFFSASNVNATANSIMLDSPSLMGMNAALRWTSLRNESLKEPTDVPELLVNFDHIAENLIDAGHGKVICHECNKMYSVQKLKRKPEWDGGWLCAHYLCPAQHSLLFREVAHFMFKRNYE